MTCADGRIRDVPQRHPQHPAGDFVNPACAEVHAPCTSPAYGRPVSRALENRAAVFTNQPQDVEVYQDGVWWPGSLLGWRHDTHGSCQVWVRIRIGGSESTVWTELDALRLPDAGPGRPAEPVAAPSWMEPALAVSEAPVTRELQRIGDGVPTAPPAGRTPDARKGADREATPSWRLAAARAEQVATPGRHRAPAAAGAGRHRAADTEMFPAVTDIDSTIRHRMPRPVTVEAHPPAPATRSWPPQGEPEGDVFTRRLRLNPLASTSAPPPRATAWDARLG